MTKKKSDNAFKLPGENPGQILREARIVKKLSPSRLATKLKVSKQQLKAIEEWDEVNLPERIYLVGLIKNYSKFVGVNSEMLLKQLSESELSNEKKPDQIKHTVFRSKRYFVLSRAMVVLVVLVITLGAFGYIAWQSAVFTAKPKLIVNSPQSGEIVHSEVLDINGEVGESTQVFINGSPSLVGPDGSFESSIVLQAGPNSVEISAVNNISRETVIEKIVIFEPLDSQR